MPDPIAFRQRLLDWYGANARSLPWRAPGTSAWQILVSEIMLQQTRVEAVLPYYTRFLARFPDAAAFAAISDAEVLAAWSGLGYYSRARNLYQAARLIAKGIQPDHAGLRALPGIGPYTAAAVSSIAFGLPYAAVDGNVLRVLARFTGDSGDIASSVTQKRITAVAQDLLDRKRPGDFNQAMMELGATVCVPRNPRCLVCPVAIDCVARQQARQHELPVKRAKAAPTPARCDVIIVRRHDQLLLKQRPSDASRMPGFWELPAPGDVPNAPVLREAGEFKHTIVNTRYHIRVLIAAPFKRAYVAGAIPEMKWFSQSTLAAIPLTTVTRKALTQTALSHNALTHNVLTDNVLTHNVLTQNALSNTS